MLYLKCTAHVQKALGLNKLSLHQAQPSQAPLGHWLVNRFDLGNRKALVFMSEPTLLSFILYEGVRPLSPVTLPQMFLAGLTQLLAMRGFAEKSIADATRPYHTGQFAKTDSRASLGSLNDMVGTYQWLVEAGGGLHSCNLSAIIMQINKTPQRRLNWACAWDAVSTKLQVLS